MNGRHVDMILIKHKIIIINNDISFYRYKIILES